MVIFDSGSPIVATQRLVLPLIRCLAIAIVVSGFQFSVSLSASAQSFTDVPSSHAAFREIEIVASYGLTSGCGSGQYCPDDSTTRSQLAIFITRATRPRTWMPDPANGSIFSDIASTDFAASYIEQLAKDVDTLGCSSTRYCPNDDVKRSNVAVLLLKAKYGPTYSPPAATGVYADVSPGSWAADWIEALTREQITSGCGGGNYCPSDLVTRADMAVLVVRTFGL